MKRFIVLFVIVSIFFGMTGCDATSLDESENPQFDYYVECTTKEQLTALEKELFVDSIFPFSLMIFERPGKTSLPRQIAYYATESFEKIDTSSFDRVAVVKEDMSILSDPGCNPIIISSSLASDEHLSIGDIMEQPCKLTDQPLTFTVGAICNHEPLFAQYEAIILLNFEEEFVPGMLCRNGTQDEVAALAREDIAPYYEDYQTHINRMK